MVRSAMMMLAAMFAVMVVTTSGAMAQEAPEREGLEFVAKIGKFVMGTTTLPVHERPAATRWVDLLAERVRESDGHCLVVKAYGTADVNRYPSHHPTQNHVLAMRRCHETANNFGSRSGVDKSSFICMAPMAPTADSERYVFLYLDHSKCEERAGQRDRDAGQDRTTRELGGRVDAFGRRLDGKDVTDVRQDEELESLRRVVGGLWGLTWGNVRIGTQFRLIGDDPGGEIFLSGSWRSRNQVLELEVGFSVGLGNNPELDQSYEDSKFASVLAGFAALRFWLDTQWSVGLGIAVGANNTGDMNEHDEILVMSELALRYTGGSATDAARGFGQLGVGYTRTVADDYQDRNLLGLTVGGGVAF